MDQETLKKPVDLQGLSLALAKTKADYDGKFYSLYDHITQSDWNEDDIIASSYVLNRPAIRAGEGENSVMIGQIEPDEDAAIYHITFDYPTERTDTVTFTAEDDLSTSIFATTTINKKVLFIELSYSYTNGATGNTEAVNKYYTIKDIDITNSIIIFESKLPYGSSNTYSVVSGKIYYGYQKAIGSTSIVEGHYNLTQGACSHAEGSNSKALGGKSHAEGSFSHALGIVSHAEGSNTVAQGSYSHAEGSYSKALGSYSHTEGDYTTAKGACSHVGGNGTFVSGEGSFAHGYFGYFTNKVTLNGKANTTTYTVINGTKLLHVDRLIGGSVNTNNTMFGVNHIIDATVDDNNAVNSITLETTLNKSNDVSGEYYILIPTKASGDYSFAEGYASQACGNYSHAEGLGTYASGPHSHVEGNNTAALGDNQHVQGKFNIEDSAGTYADIVGNGTSDSARSNAYTLDWSGNGWYAGKVTVGAGPTENMDVATKQYVDAATAGVSPNLSGLADTNISSPATGQILTYDGTTSKWVNTTSPYMTASQVNELIAAALAQYGDGDTATYGFEDASEVSY